MASSFADTVASLAAGDDMAALATACEGFELNLGHTELADTSASLHIYKVHLAAYLLCARLDDARFLWKRLPAEIRDADAELVALWAIGKAMWVKDPAAAQAAMAAHSWSPPVVQSLVARMQREHLEQSFVQAAKAYRHVSAAHLAQILGVPVAKIDELAAAANWPTDAESGAYRPCAPDVDDAPPMMMEQLGRLTNYVAHIEREVK